MFKKFNSIKLFVLFLLIFASNQVNANENKPKLQKHFVFDTIPTDLSDQAEMSDRIIHGIVTDKKHKKNSKNIGYYEISIKVIEWIKPSTNTDKSLTIKIWDATSSSFSFNVGEEVIAAFHPDSELGFTTPVAIGQGLYKISSQNTNGNLNSRYKTALNIQKNIGLARNLKTKKYINLRDSSLLKRIEEKSNSGEAISADDLKAAFKDLVNH